MESTVKTPNFEAVLQADAFRPTDGQELSVAVLPCGTYFFSACHDSCLWACYEAFFFGVAPTDCTQDLTPGQQLSMGSVLLGSSWLHDGSLNRPPADGNVVPAESGAPLRRLTTIIPC